MGKSRDFKIGVRIFPAAGTVGELLRILSEGSGFGLNRKKSNNQSQKQIFFHFLESFYQKAFLF